MKHVIKNYETRINELQKLYDHDVFSLENENEKLRKEVKELQSNYLNVSHSNSSFAIDFEDLKASYDDKINNLKSHYEDLLQKECVNAKKQQNELLSENNKLQTIVEEAEKKFLQHLQNMEANINSNYHTDLTSEVQKILSEKFFIFLFFVCDKRSVHDNYNYNLFVILLKNVPQVSLSFSQRLPFCFDLC